ncbi:MAG: hypothetical protein IMY67_11245 [Bacteroidetes bacterium]|nr:hypothetical protein [Bacteroidota bacterium]
MLIQPLIARPVTIEGYGHYVVGYWGGFLLNTRTGNIVKGWLTKEGYRRCELLKGKKTSLQYIHRLVALVWCYNSDLINKDEVNHLNWIRNDCDAFNLSWCTKKRNLEYRYNYYMKQFESHQVQTTEHEPVPEISEDSDLPF